MKDFIYKLFSASSAISSKRFISIFSLLVLTVVIGFIISVTVVPDIVINSLDMLILGSSTLTLIPSKKPDAEQ